MVTTIGHRDGLVARGRVESVNVGGRREVQWEGRTVETAIWKSPTSGPIDVRGINLEGDDQADRRVHGGPDKAVYAYAAEDYEWWEARLGVHLEPGTFGENLTVSGIDLAGAVIGDRWQAGSVVLQVTQPRLPCYKLGVRMGDQAFVDRFERAQRYGSYFRIVGEGAIAGGDTIAVVSRPEHDLTITDLGRSSPKPDEDTLDRILAVAEVPQSWRDWAERARMRLR